MTTGMQAEQLANSAAKLYERKLITMQGAIITAIPLVELLDAAKAAHRMIEAEKLDVTRGNLCQLAAHLEAIKEKGVSLD